MAASPLRRSRSLRGPHIVACQPEARWVSAQPRRSRCPRPVHPAVAAATMSTTPTTIQNHTWRSNPMNESVDFGPDPVAPIATRLRHRRQVPVPAATVGLTTTMTAWWRGQLDRERALRRLTYGAGVMVPRVSELDLAATGSLPRSPGLKSWARKTLTVDGWVLHAAPKVSNAHQVTKSAGSSRSIGSRLGAGRWP